MKNNVIQLFPMQSEQPKPVESEAVKTETELKNNKCVIEYNPEARYATGFFDGRDLTDKYNEPCFYSKTMRSHKKAWAALQKAFNGETTMNEAMHILEANKIDCHSYCAMD